VKAPVGHALFALILGSSVLANTRPADHPPADAEQLATAVITIARSNDLTFRGRTALASQLIDALTFDAKGCREPITVALLSVMSEQAPLLETQNLEGRTLYFVFYDRRWRAPDRVAIAWERKQQKALALFGLTRFVPSAYMLAIAAASDCRAADVIDWQNVWDRRYLASLAVDHAARKPE
jgi:hypothetical protein